MLHQKLWFFSAIVLLSLGPRPGSAEVVLVQAETLSLRERPSTSARRLEQLATYQPVKVLSRRNEGGRQWVQVETTSGKRGWVLQSSGSKRYLSRTAFVSVDPVRLKQVNADKLNVREGPGTNYARIFKVAENYPLYVLDRTASGWIKVLDFDGDTGWVSGKLVTFGPHVITQLQKSYVRKGPSQDYEEVFTADRGVLFAVREEKNGWLRVRHDDGDEGWMSAKIVFGWHDAEFDHVGFPKGRTR